jgi:hypothetical protein
MKFIKTTVALFATLTFLISCQSPQEKAHHLGETYVKHLNKGEKLLNIAWTQNSNLWILTRPMTQSDSAVTYEFSQEKGYHLQLYGNGKIVIVESK